MARRAYANSSSRRRRLAKAHANPGSSEDRTQGGGRELPERPRRLARDGELAAGEHIAGCGTGCNPPPQSDLDSENLWGLDEVDSGAGGMRRAL